MIFVTLGTQDKPFDRVVKKIDELVEKKIIKEEVIIQCGASNVKTKNVKLVDFIPYEDFNSYIENSSYIIAHAGVGSVLDGLKARKKVIVVPRLAKYNEQKNDHQLQITEEFGKRGLIIPCKDENDLEKAISKLKDFTPKTFESNTNNFVNLIEDFIDNN